jgi:transcriptional regulator of arginine metabolism
LNTNKIPQTRLQALEELIRKHHIKNQKMLVNLLKKNYGIETNQSVVSRDLRELGIIKKKHKNALVYELQEPNTTKEILQLGVIDIVQNESMIIVKTLPGLASFVGDFLDTQDKIGILATLAGENVVFIAPHSTKQISHVFAAICELTYFKKIQNKEKTI